MTHKAFVPGTYVVGSQPILEKDKTGRMVQKVDAASPLFLANGKPHGSHLLRLVPAWQPGQQLGVVSHFRNEAARRRCGGDMSKADKKDLVQVPVFRGISCALASDLRAAAKRQRKKSLIERIKAMIQEGKGVAGPDAKVTAEVSLDDNAEDTGARAFTLDKEGVHVSQA